MDQNWQQLTNHCLHYGITQIRPVSFKDQRLTPTDNKTTFHLTLKMTSSQVVMQSLWYTIFTDKQGLINNHCASQLKAGSRHMGP